MSGQRIAEDLGRHVRIRGAAGVRQQAGVVGLRRRRRVDPEPARPAGSRSACCATRARTESPCRGRWPGTGLQSTPRLRPARRAATPRLTRRDTTRPGAAWGGRCMLRRWRSSGRTVSRSPTSAWARGRRWCSCTAPPGMVGCGSRSSPPWRTSSRSSHGTSRGRAAPRTCLRISAWRTTRTASRKLIEALALGPAHVAGLSWGGTVVLELYRRHPGLVATLILADTYAGWKGSLPEEEVRARVAGARQMLAAPAEEFDPTLPGLFAGDPPADFVALLEEIAAAVRPDTLRIQLSLMAEADQRDLLPGIVVPTLLIWGELDARSPLDVARQFEQAIPDTKLDVIPGVRPREQPRGTRAVQRCRARVLPAMTRCPGAAQLSEERPPPAPGGPSIPACRPPCPSR